MKRSGQFKTLVQDALAPYGMSSVANEDSDLSAARAMGFYDDYENYSVWRGSPASLPNFR